MKKIFAIALALVMVLSMASAFAAQCVTPNWACAEDVCALGKGKVEIIPYVKGNGCEGGVTFTANTCAGAVNKDNVYFAVKVTVDANPNTEWWADAALEIKETDVTITKGNKTAAAGVVANAIAALDKNKELKAGEYYILATGAVVKAEDFKANEASLYVATVNVASSAKVCAVLTATNDYDGGKVNGYDVAYAKGKTNPSDILAFTKDGKTVLVYVDTDEKIVKFVVRVNGTEKEVTTYSADGSKFHDDKTGKDFDWTCDEWGKFLKGVMDSFNLAFQTCITHKAVVANFGWDDEIKGCFEWSDKVVSVVDAECVVAIPKTGDASVLAWLF